MSVPGIDPREAVIAIPEIRDYERINGELVQQLDAGCSLVRLTGAEGQRFLGAGLSGTWQAVIEIEGFAGPELAASLDAPGLTIVCRGTAGDGAGRGMRAGRVLVLEAAADALGYALQGGAILAAASADHRAGLNQQGGILAVLGTLGRLAGERQAGGWFFAHDQLLGPYCGRGRRGGHFVRLAPGHDLAGVDPVAAEVYRGLLRDFDRWLPHVRSNLIA